MPADRQRSPIERPAALALASISAGVSTSDMSGSLFAEMHTVKSILATRPSVAECALHQSIMGWDRDALVALVWKMAEAAQTDLTGLARLAGLAPSTLTRFVNSDAKHLLTTRTLTKLSEASGVPLPGAPSSSAPDSGLGLVAAVARAVGVDLAQLEMSLTPRARRWLALIEQIPASAENNAFELLSGLVDPTRSPEKKSRPRKRPGIRRKG
jgi:hypothetical protein